MRQTFCAVAFAFAMATTPAEAALDQAVPSVATVRAALGTPIPWQCSMQLTREARQALSTPLARVIIDFFIFTNKLFNWKNRDSIDLDARSKCAPR